VNPLGLQIARRDVPTCLIGETIAAARSRAQGWTTCFVVNERRIVLGRLLAEELSGDPGAPVEDVMRAGPSTFRPNVSVAEMLGYMDRHGLATAPISRSDGELVGLLLREDAERVMRAAPAAPTGPPRSIR